MDLSSKALGTAMVFSNWEQEDGVCVGGGVLIFYCCVINYHKLSGFKQHTFILLQFLWTESLCSGGWAPLRGSHTTGVPCDTGGSSRS